MYPFLDFFLIYWNMKQHCLLFCKDKEFSKKGNKCYNFNVTFVCEWRKRSSWSNQCVDTEIGLYLGGKWEMLFNVILLEKDLSLNFIYFLKRKMISESFRTFQLQFEKNLKCLLIFCLRQNCYVTVSLSGTSLVT